MNTQCRNCECPLLCLIGERRRVCVRCASATKSANNKRYRAAHSESVKAQQREHYVENRDLKLSMTAAYYERNRDTIITKKRQRDAARKELK